MSAKIIDLVDAVVSRLTAATYSQSFTANKLLFPRTDEVTALSVDVFVKEENRERLSRSGDFLKEYSIAVSIQVPLTSDANAGIETYLALAEEFKDDLATQKMAGLTLNETEQNEPYNVEILANSGIFSTHTVYTYKGF